MNADWCFVVFLASFWVGGECYHYFFFFPPSPHKSWLPDAYLTWSKVNMLLYIFCVAQLCNSVLA